MKAIIFDLDGTLLDTLEDIADSMNATLKAFNLPDHPTEAYKHLIGGGVANLVKLAAPDAEKAGYDPAQILSRYQKEYAVRQADKTAPYAEIPELLAALADKGIKMAVLSNKPHEATIQIIANYFPDTYFDCVLGQTPERPVKPDPGGALEVLALFGESPEDVIYLGDSGSDMRLAKLVGLIAVGALWGFRDRDELLSNGADDLVETPMDILRFF